MHCIKNVLMHAVYLHPGELGFYTLTEFIETCGKFCDVDDHRHCEETVEYGLVYIDYITVNIGNFHRGLREYADTVISDYRYYSAFDIVH